MNSSEAASAPAQPPRSTSTLSVTPEAASSQGLLRACSPREQPPGSQCACLLSCFSHVRLFATLWTVVCQAPLSMGFSRQEYWSGLPFLSPGDLPDPEIEPGSPALQAVFTDC